LFVGAAMSGQPGAQEDLKTEPENNDERQRETSVLNVHYLEIVTPEVDETCAALQAMHGVKFGDPIAELGAARTAELKTGGRIGVRGRMHAAEASVVRPYVLVDDIAAAVEAAEAAGGQVAVPPMEIPGHGTCAIYFLGGIEHGLWELWSGGEP